MPHPGEREVYGTSCVPQFHRMWHNFHVLWKGEEVDMGSKVPLLYHEVTEASNSMVTHPHTAVTVDSQQFQLLEHFIIIIYDKTSSLQSVNAARKEVVCQKNRTMEKIPPIQDALLQHTKCVTYQAGIWTTCDKAQKQTPTADGCGWTLDTDAKSWCPVWNNLPMASKGCNELVRCGCGSASGCGRNCSCREPHCRCTEL